MGAGFGWCYASRYLEYRQGTAGTTGSMRAHIYRCQVGAGLVQLRLVLLLKKTGRASSFLTTQTSLFAGIQVSLLAHTKPLTHSGRRRAAEVHLIHRTMNDVV